MKLHYLAIFAVALPFAAQAKPLTFEAALSEARANAPALTAKVLAVEAAESALDAAGRLPDPTASVGIESFPISGPLAFRPGQDDFTWLRFGFSQEFPNPAKRRAQAGRAQSDIATAQAESAVASALSVSMSK